MQIFCSTPLHLAVESQNEAVFKLILDTSFLDLDVKNSEGHPALWLALRTFGGQGSAAAAEDMAAALADNGASVDVVCDRDNNTLLHMCASRGLEAAAQFVIGQGGSCDAVNSVGDTPLHSVRLSF